MTYQAGNRRDQILDALKSKYAAFAERTSKIIADYTLEKEKRSDQEFLPAAISILETPPPRSI